MTTDQISPLVQFSKKIGILIRSVSPQLCGEPRSSYMTLWDFPITLRKSSFLSTISPVHSSSPNSTFWFYGQKAGARKLLHCCVLLWLLPSLAKWWKTEREGTKAIEISQLEGNVSFSQSFGSCWLIMWPLRLPPWDGLGAGAQENEEKKKNVWRIPHSLSGVRYLLLLSQIKGFPWNSTCILVPTSELQAALHSG